jgi:hypothetical protein
MLQKRIIFTPHLEDEIDIDLFAIHSTLESYLMAFRLNNSLGSLFYNVTEKNENDEDLAVFDRFIWEQTPGENGWELISNHCYHSQEDLQANSLQLMIEKKTCLISTLENIDFFLKVPENTLTGDHVSQIRNIEGVQFIYRISEPKVLLNPNLIFE